MTRIENVSDTARWVAWYRAMETERPDRLFSDPYAARLAGDQGEAIVATRGSPSQARAADDVALEVDRPVVAGEAPGRAPADVRLVLLERMSAPGSLH